MEGTVNKNVEKYQTPNWRGHPSLLGWCQMNYPSHLIDIRQKKARSPRQKSPELSYIHQKRSASPDNTSKIYKPITKASKNKSSYIQEGVGSPPKGYKNSEYTLTTTPLEHRSFLKNQLTKDTELSRVRPLSCEIGHKDFTSRFEKKIPQVGEIKYHEEPEDEERRHLKRLPNTVLTEQSLKEVLSDQTLYLNLSNLKWVKNDHLNKLGFIAQNIQDLNIAGTVANDSTLEEIAKTLEKLKSIDISNCSDVTEKGVAVFFQNCASLTQFWSANCPHSVTNDSLRFFKKSQDLRSFNIEFCSQGCTKLTGKFVTALIQITGYQLEVLEASNLTQTEFDNEALKAVGTCSKLHKLSISGSSNIGDEGIHNLINGYKEADDSLVKREEGFRHLTEFRMSSIKANSEGALIKFCNACPNLEILDMNGFKSLEETGINMICKALPKLQIILLNFTEKITDAFLTELRQSHPNIKFVRTIISYGNPSDTGLRVPFPKIQTGKKKKKGKKKK